NWTIGKWEFEGESCTKITFDLKFKNGPFGDYRILWHDTQVFTAEDVAFTFQYMKDTYSVLFYPFVEKLDHVEVVDEYTVTIYYQVQSIWALDWAGSIPIIPKHIWENVPPLDSFAYDPEKNKPAYVPSDKLLSGHAVIGTGPFMFHSRVPGEYVRLTENHWYFRKLVWPDVCDPTHTVGVRDGYVDIWDFRKITDEGFANENPDGTWPDPPGDWGPYIDVNYDGRVNTGDLMEISVHHVPFEKVWPPPWYL
nr:hypothetical protein [Candidatus Bathyarchaeota archaeon]